MSTPIVALLVSVAIALAGCSTSGSEPSNTSNDTSNPGVTDTSNPGSTDTSNPGVTDTSNPGSTDTSTSGVTDTSNPGSTDTSTPGVTDTSNPGSTDTANPGVTDTTNPGKSAKIIFLHHSTGGNIWNGGVAAKFSGTPHTIQERNFPDDPYPWENYPYDYWNIWVNHAGAGQYNGQDTLEILTKTYNVIIFKHCFPVGEIAADTGSADVTSSNKTVENYKLQYNALKQKMRQFKDTTFIVWTGAALIKDATNEAQAIRTKAFFDWVKQQWDEKGDNIFVFDFFTLETEGGENNLYMNNSYAEGDSHPNSTFAATVAPLFAKRVINIIEGKGDTTSLTGK